MKTSAPNVLSVGLPRLLAGLESVDRLDRVGHLTVHGSLPPYRTNELVDLAENIDLRGRGGAGFPFHRKLRAVIQSAERRDGRTAVVVNGTEGEPACRKDAAMLQRSPHLVLDGATLAAEALDAEEIVIGVTKPEVEKSVQDAIDERPPGDRAISVVRLPERFVTGEGTALTRGLNGGPALPPGRKVRTSDVGLSGLPTLLSNTETFAQLAIAARLDALNFRATGLATEPGTVMLTISGSLVVETPTGVPLSYILQMCGSNPGQGVLVGGYHGKFLDANAATQALISRESLESYGARLGAGAVLPIPEDTCPLGEVLRVARWMAAESASQCGPCYLGLPALANALSETLDGGGRAALEAVRQHTSAVKGRGACSHPDGTANMVISALSTFTDDLAEHVLGNGCGRPVRGMLPLHEEEMSERLIVDWTLCEGHGLCADVLPEVVSLGADGYPMLPNMPLPAHLRAQARRAVRRCPALAMRLEK